MSIVSDILLNLFIRVNKYEYFRSVFFSIYSYLCFARTLSLSIYIYIYIYIYMRVCAYVCVGICVTTRWESLPACIRTHIHTY